MKIEQLQKTAHFHQANQSIKAPVQHGDAFAKVLQDKIVKATHPVKFSAHAVERLSSRNIILNEQDMSKINNAVDSIKEKGGKDSLLVMGDLALVVSIENRTVITAMEKQNGNDKIFTNIDSALMM